VTIIDTGRKFGHVVMAWTDRYEAHPFAMTFHLLALLLLPVLIWLLVVVGVLDQQGPIPADPVQASNDAMDVGLLVGTVATGTATAAVGVLLRLLRRRPPK
jgi:hypothetical protein